MVWMVCDREYALFDLIDFWENGDQRPNISNTRRTYKNTHQNGKSQTSLLYNLNEKHLNCILKYY